MSEYLLTDKDITLYLAGCAIGVRHEAEVIPFLISNIYLGVLTGKLCTDPEQEVSCPLYVNGVFNPVLILKYNQSGFINTPKSVLYLERLIRRAWKWSLHPENWSIIDPLSKERERANYSQYVSINNRSFLYSVFNPIYHSWDKALSLLLNGEKAAVALNKHWCIAWKLGHKEPVVYHYEFCIGRVRNGKICLPESLTPLVDELIDLDVPTEIVLDADL